MKKKEFRRMTAGRKNILPFFVLNILLIGLLSCISGTSHASAQGPSHLAAPGQQLFHEPAETAAAYGDQKRFLNSTLITLVLGTLFLIGEVGVEWQLAPYGPGEDASWSFFIP